jgi:putative ABC transport system permease protein
VRSALGAGRGRLVQQMLTENSILALSGGAIGAALGHVGTRLLETLVPAGLPGSSLGADARVLTFNLAATALTVLLFGLLPAFRSAHVNPNDALKQGSRGGIGGRSGAIRNVLVVSEVALAIVLLVCAGLMIRTLHNMRTAEAGFEAGQVLTLRLTLPPRKYPDQQKLIAFYESVQERVQALPGVRSAAFAGNLPFTAIGNTNGYVIEG